jgi:hypothetical protein
MSFAIRAPRLLTVAFLAAATAFSVGGLLSPQSADAATSQRARIVNIAMSYVGNAQYRFGAEGTEYVDCSGLVWRVYKQAGLEAKIGGARMGARSYYYWFKRRGLASRSNPKPGDLVIWRKGKHIGIYVGNGYAVSALNTKYDVRKHKVNWLGGFTAYLHVRLDGTRSGDSNDGDTSTTNYLFKATPKVDNLVVRDGPGTSHDRVATIDKGTVIRVVDKALDSRDRRWFKAKLPNGKVGWVMAAYVHKL